MSTELELPINRERMWFARAIQARCVSEWPRTQGGTETRRRLIGGSNNLAKPSFYRCKNLAAAFADAGLAVRPTEHLPADWTLTPKGEEYLQRAKAEYGVTTS